MVAVSYTLTQSLTRPRVYTAMHEAVLEVGNLQTFVFTCTAHLGREEETASLCLDSIFHLGSSPMPIHACARRTPCLPAGKIMWLAVFLHFIACLWLSLGRQAR